MRLAAVTCLVLGTVGPAWSDTPSTTPPACHTAPAAAPAAAPSEGAYVVPRVELFDQDGRKVDLAALLDGPRPVALNFIFTTCRTICPVLSGSLAHLRNEVGPDARVQLVSITIDPEFDSPAVLREYARRFDAGPEWKFLTGRSEDILAVRQAFGAYLGDKNAHRPLTFLRPAGGTRWARIDGFAPTEQMVAELLGTAH